MPIEISVIGTAEAFSNVGIRSQITGQLETVNFTEGDDVQQGQVLFTLDRRPLELALREAQANLERDTARAENAALMAKRYEDLAKRGIAHARAGGHLAFRHERAQRHGQRRQGGSRERHRPARLRDDQGPHLRAAPARCMVHEGNLVRANDKTPLVTINQIMPISVAFSVPEARLSDLKRYMAGRLVAA